MKRVRSVRQLLPDRHCVYEHALIMWTGTAIKLKSLSGKYRTWVNAKILSQNSQIDLVDNDEIVFGAFIDNKCVKVRFEYQSTSNLAKHWSDVNVSIFGNGKIYKYLLKDNDVLSIGRGICNVVSDADTNHSLRYDNIILSRNHAVIKYKDGQITITDLKSTKWHIDP